MEPKKIRLATVLFVTGILLAGLANAASKLIIKEYVANADMPAVIPAYERRGDTVFITFDSFNLNSVTKFYSDGFEPDPNSGDTIELFAYALRRLQNEDSDAKNVVVDIACNGGGTAVSCGYVIDALIGKCILCLQNPNTNALSQNEIKYDLNLDGVIDKNDVSMKAMGKNIAVVMSDSSFSCGNLLPCALNALDDDVLLMGQTSGGGSCEVGYLSTLLGSTMQISGEKMLVTMKNGYIRDIDGGVAPEIALSSNRMFDRDYLVDVVNDAFSTAEPQKLTNDQLYERAVRDAKNADEDEIMPLVNISKDDENVIWSEDGKRVLVTFMHKYPDSYLYSKYRCNLGRQNFLRNTDGCASTRRISVHKGKVRSNQRTQLVRPPPRH